MPPKKNLGQQTHFIAFAPGHRKPQLCHSATYIFIAKMQLHRFEFCARLFLMQNADLSVYICIHVCVCECGNLLL